MALYKTTDTVEIPMRQTVSVFKAGASVFAAAPMLWEVQVWYRNCGLFSATPIAPVNFLSFDLGITIDEVASQTTVFPPLVSIVPNGERMWPGPRGARRQIFAQSVQFLAAIGSGLSTPLIMVTRIAPAPGVSPTQNQVLLNEGAPGTPFPRYTTEFRFLNRPGATYTLLDSAGQPLADNVQTYTGLPVSAAMEWRPIHWLAAGLQSDDADLLYFEVR